MIVSCADESGTDFSGPTPYASIAGFLGPTTAWKGLCKAWADVLDEFGLSGFHMTKWLRRKEGPYSSWTEARNLGLVGRLVEVINRYNLRGFALQIAVDDYKQMGYTEPIYLVLFDGVLSTLNAIMAAEILSEETLWTEFGRTSSMESRASRLYAYRLANDQSMRDRFWLEYPQFISVAEQRGLEAADLLANVARNYVRGRADPELDTFLATQNLRQIIGYNHTEFRVMTTDEIAQSIERVRESVRYV